MATISMSGFCLFLTASAQHEKSFRSIAAFGGLNEPDRNGVMLPQGFRSRIVARSASLCWLSSYVWHPAPDGGACYGTEDGGWIYVSNSECRRKRWGGALRFNSAGQKIDSLYFGKYNTKLCWGPTPWGAWLSCEEFDHGQVFECDPYGKVPARVRPALGSFKHEAVTVDMINNKLYLTEDLPDGGFYRFVPDKRLPDYLQVIWNCIISRAQRKKLSFLE